MVMKDQKKKKINYYVIVKTFGDKKEIRKCNKMY